jgi:hypothetical protein
VAHARLAGTRLNPSIRNDYTTSRHATPGIVFAH